MRSWTHHFSVWVPHPQHQHQLDMCPTRMQILRPHSTPTELGETLEVGHINPRFNKPTRRVYGLTVSEPQNEVHGSENKWRDLGTLRRGNLLSLVAAEGKERVGSTELPSQSPGWDLNMWWHPLEETGNTAGGSNQAPQVRENGFGFKHLWVEMTLPSLTSHSTLRIFQDMICLCYIIAEFECSLWTGLKAPWGLWSGFISPPESQAQVPT